MSSYTTQIRHLNPARAKFAAILSIGLMVSGNAALTQGAPDRLGRKIDTGIKGKAVDVLAEVQHKTGLGILMDAGFAPRDLDVKAGSTATEALDTVSASLDCTWKLSRPGVVVLSRRFRRPGELPQANLSELRQSARDAIAGIGALGSEVRDDSAWAPILKQLAATLTQEQLGGLGKGQKLDAAALSPEQRQLTESAVLSRTFGGLRTAWELFASRIASLDRAVLRVQLRPSGAGGTRRAVCTFVDPAAGPPDMLGEFPLNVNGADRRALPAVASGPLTPAGPAQAATGLDSRVTMPGGITSVAELAASLSAQCGVQIGVDPSMGERRVVFPCSDLPLNDVLDAVSTLYGWRWSKNDDGGIVIVRHRLPLPRRPSEVSGYLRAILPTDLRLYLDLLPPGDKSARLAQARFHPYGGSTAAGGIRPRKDGAISAVLAAVARKFGDSDAPVADISYNKLSSEDAELVRLALVALVFQDADDQVWYNESGMQDMDALDVKLWLDYNNEILMVSRFIGDKTTGFGANVKR